MCVCLCVCVFVCMSVAVGSNLKEKMGASRGMGQWKFVQENRLTSYNQKKEKKDEHYLGS